MGRATTRRPPVWVRGPDGPSRRVPSRAPGARRYVLPILTVLLLLVEGSFLGAGASPACTPPLRPTSLLPARVERVVDGDTIVVRLRAGREEKVRLLGIDTPEVHPSEKLGRDAARSGQDRKTIRTLGRRASAYTRDQLSGQFVDLERDVRARDRHGRLLAYVWQRDGTLFNLTILRDGYAEVLTVPPNVRYAVVLRACHQEARTVGRGLWAR